MKREKVVSQKTTQGEGLGKMKTNTRRTTLFLTQFSVLLAIEALFCFTPLGSIPIGPLVATLGMLPVIITAIMLGTKAGSAMGFCAGLFSFLVWTFMPPSPIAFVFTPFYSLGEFRGNFWSLVICFVPRILVGTVAGLVYHGLHRLDGKKDWWRYVLSGLSGSLTNTVLVLGGIWLFFGDAYASIANKAILAIIGSSVLTNGIPEAIVSIIVAVAVCKPLKQIFSNQNLKKHSTR